MKKIIFFFSALFFLSIFFFKSASSFAVNEVCNAGNNTCCTAVQIVQDGGGCPAGTVWIGGNDGSCEAPRTCQGTRFNCATNACISNPPPLAPGPLCPGRLEIDSQCYDILTVVKDRVIAVLFKIWDGTALKRLVYVDDADCENGQVIKWNSAQTKWECGAITVDSITATRFAGFSNTTPAPVSGDLDGYLLANNYCASSTDQLSGSHICTAEEIIDSYVASNVPVDAIGIAWINNGPPSNTDTFVNDCGGWNSSDPARYGAVWNFTTDEGGIQPCNAQRAFACCK